jgi:hypothetical protein
MAFEVAKRNVSNFLKVEMESIKAGDAINFGIRTNIWTYFKSSNLPFPVLIKGNVDRIEERNG